MKRLNEYRYGVGRVTQADEQVLVRSEIIAAIDGLPGAPSYRVMQFWHGDTERVVATAQAVLTMDAYAVIEPWLMAGVDGATEASVREAADKLAYPAWCAWRSAQVIAAAEMAAAAKGSTN